jgi:hypothetical protein
MYWNKEKRMYWQEKLKQLKRWDVFCGQGERFKEIDPSGEYVMYEDVVKLLESLTQEDF